MAYASCLSIITVTMTMKPAGRLRDGGFLSAFGKHSGRQGIGKYYTVLFGVL
jgi:hypothetical protein